MKDKKKRKKRKKKKSYIHNIFTKILNSKLLYAVVDGKKIILVAARFKLESVII